MANGVHIRKMATRMLVYVIKEITDADQQRQITEHLLEILKVLDHKGVKGETQS